MDLARSSMSDLANALAWHVRERVREPTITGRAPSSIRELRSAN